MGREDKETWKANYFLRIKEYFETYKSVFIVGADNVRSSQMQQIRQSLRGQAVLLMGKNTMIRKALRGFQASMPQLEKVLPYVKGNIGFVFTNEDLKGIRDCIEINKVAAPAKAGAMAPVDVFVSSQNTGLGPEKTSFFQALSIATKITKGTIEIINAVHLIKEGTRVSPSEATLLHMLKIMPFSYNLNVLQVFDDGSVFLPKVLDIQDDDLLESFMQGVAAVASVSLAIGYPTVVSVPHSIVNGFKNLLAVAAATDLSFKEAEQMKEFLADPGKFLVAAPVVETKAAEEPAKKEEAKAESGSDSEGSDMGMGLFD